MRINRQRIKIFPKEGGFVGYLLNFEDLIFETPVLNSVAECNTAITKFLKESSPIPLSAPKHSAVIPTMANRALQRNSPTSRSCCGRG